MVLTVSEITRNIKTCFDATPVFREITIQGEISNFKKNFNGHCYFSLKDNKSVIPCAMFQWSTRNLKFVPNNGMKVLATGHITVYETGGYYQLVVQKMVPDGIGELALAFDQLKAKLATEGLFDEAHKQKLPKFTKVIGVVTSPTGAVIRDIYRVSKIRNPYSRIVLYPAQVQGAGAAEQIVAGIEFFNNKYPVDALIVGRGGGSAEDLWCFNEEIVVRAIYNSKIPVISAVGHETDFTLSDFAADLRAATPSHAAEQVTPDIKIYIENVRKLNTCIGNYTYKNIALKKQALEYLLNSVTFKYPERLLLDKRQRFDNLLERLNVNADALKNNKYQKLDKLMAKLELMNPLSVLRRGYSMTKNEHGNIVKSIADVKPGERITVALSDGSLQAVVEEKE